MNRLARSADRVAVTAQICRKRRNLGGANGYVDTSDRNDRSFVRIIQKMRVLFNGAGVWLAQQHASWSTPIGINTTTPEPVAKDLRRHVDVGSSPTLLLASIRQL